MTVPNGFEGLRFPCECVSSRRGGYSEPWAAVAKHKLLPDGTKEEILNLVAREPKTISQLAEALGLSAPSVFAHVSDMLKSKTGSVSMSLSDLTIASVPVLYFWK
ncbi:MAG TPA: winged helix-turn-helix domain-containing protein [Pyrinomonadaceae bacterium]|jgi:DNA-binding transcriptional ArsR family regulator